MNQISTTLRDFHAASHCLFSFLFHGNEDGDPAGHPRILQMNLHHFPRLLMAIQLSPFHGDCFVEYGTCGNNIIEKLFQQLLNDAKAGKRIIFKTIMDMEVWPAF